MKVPFYMAAPEKGYSPVGRRGAVFISWRALAAGLFLALAVAVACAVLLGNRKSSLDQGMASLINAFGRSRMIEPRLSGGFRAGEINSSMEAITGINRTELARARDLITDAIATGEPVAHLAYGRLLLSQGESNADALKHLRFAAERMPESAAAHNDLGTCLMERGQIESAVDEFDLALRLDPQMPEATFNRALCYRRLELRTAARRDLTRLAEFEGDQGWLDEVSRRREDLSLRVTKPLPEQKLIEKFDNAIEIGDVNAAQAVLRLSYERVERRLLDHWEDYLASDVAGAMRAISIIETINRLAREINDDRSIPSVIEYMRSVTPGEKRVELRLLRQLKDAVGDVSGGKYGEALPQLARLRRVYKARGNHQFYVRAGYAIAECEYNLGRYQPCIETLKADLPLVNQNGWTFNESRALVLIGLAYSRNGQDSTALRYYNQSLEVFRRLNEPPAKPLQYIALSYLRLGDFKTALAQLRGSTEHYLKGDPRSDELANNYLSIAEIYRQTDSYNLARLFAEQSFEVAELDNNRAAQASSLIAVADARSSDFSEARRAVKQALIYVGNLQSGERAYTEPLVMTRAGEVAMLEGNGAAALDYYARADALLSTDASDKILRVRALAGRAAAYAKAGDRDKARADLRQAINVIEIYREDISNRSHRAEFLAASQGVFDQMINLDATDVGLATHAFEMAEASRARSLKDDISSPPALREGGAKSRDGKQRTNDAVSLRSGNESAFPALAEVQAALPDDVTLLEYSLTSERTYIFVVSRAGFGVVTSAATAGDVQRKVSDYVTDITNRAALSDLSEKSRELYRLLIEPVEAKIGEGRGLCIVPDKALSFLPFAALKDKSGRYLIESRRLIYAPSASALLRCIRQGESREAGPERLLAVGNPRFNPDEFAELGDLAEGEREAGESARFYEDVILLKGARATEANVRRALKECDVAHLALHCLVDQQSPWTAAMVLASKKPARKIRAEGDGSRAGPAATDEDEEPTAPVGAAKATIEDPTDGLLHLRELYDLGLARTRLVVLSACNSGPGQFYSGEGVISLINPFIAARVSTVVASLWPVESEATGRLMVEFHRLRKTSNRRAADALRGAQLSRIEQGDSHPYYWASFIAIGDNY